MTDHFSLAPEVPPETAGTTQAWKHALAEPHVLSSLWALPLSSVGAGLVEKALEVGLFAQTEQAVSAATLAQRLALSPGRLAYALEVLWSLGMLLRRQQADGEWLYGTAPELSPYLNPVSESYCGDALLFRFRVLRQAADQVMGLLSDEVPVVPPRGVAGQPALWAEAARVQIAQEQAAVSAEVALSVMSAQSEFGQAQTVLDLGGGPGLVAIELARHQPLLSGVVFDFPEVVSVARENIATAGLEDRLSVLGGDLSSDELGKGYDVIWCSSVFHFVPDLPGLLARLHEALSPGGLLVCAHAVIGAEGWQNRAVAPYYLNLRLQGGRVLAAGQLEELLLAAGFSGVDSVSQVRFPVAPVNVVIARKEGGRS
ncbi:methyltransferase [Marinobacter daepoensis]|uniref:methyltransferase n=1 Tax=Marinobacter daepoensis TaxID=262077 RepID=UPI0004266EEF|nr:methyltransferase [Marinobacter daepoensis]